MRAGVLVAIGLGLAWAHALNAQVAGCFRTAAEAAAGRGPAADTGGFRLQAVVDDVLGGGRWAAVVHCGHPERPAVMLRAAGASRAATRPTAPAVPAGGARFVVAGGEAVRLIRTEETLRLEVAGVAEASGAVGDRIRVRLARGADSTEDRFCFAVVRAAGVLEMER